MKIDKILIYATLGFALAVGNPLSAMENPRQDPQLSLIEQGRRWALSWFIGAPSVPQELHNFSRLPNDVKREILDFARENIFNSIIVKDDWYQTRKNIATFASTSKNFRAFINNPENMITLVERTEKEFKSTYYTDKFRMAYRLRNMPGTKHETFRAWLKKALDKEVRLADLEFAVRHAPYQLKAFIAAGIDIKSFNKILSDIVIDAVLISDESCSRLIKTLIDVGADIKDNSAYLLTRAVEENMPKTVKVLMNAGADPRQGHRNGLNAFQYARLRRNPEIEYLLYQYYDKIPKG